MIDHLEESTRGNHDTRWATVDGLTLSVWPDEDEAIVYLRESGDMHWLSGTARLILESLATGLVLTERQIHSAITEFMECDKDDVAEHCIPYLCSLGLICQVEP